MVVERLGRALVWKRSKHTSVTYRSVDKSIYLLIVATLRRSSLFIVMMFVSLWHQWYLLYMTDLFTATEDVAQQVSGFFHCCLVVFRQIILLVRVAHWADVTAVNQTLVQTKPLGTQKRVVWVCPRSKLTGGHLCCKSNQPTTKVTMEWFLYYPDHFLFSLHQSWICLCIS